MSKNCLRASEHWPISPTFLYTHTHTQHRDFHLENGSLHPQSGARLTSCTLGLQRSLWEDVNSARSLLQERVTRDLLDPWSRAWSTGSVREAEVKPCGAGAETSPRTEAGSPEHRRQSLSLGCWGGDGAGRVESICCVAISPDSSVVTLRGRSWEGVCVCVCVCAVKYPQHKIDHYSHL